MLLLEELEVEKDARRSSSFSSNIYEGGDRGGGEGWVKGQRGRVGRVEVGWVGVGIKGWMTEEREIR